MKTELPTKWFAQERLNYIDVVLTDALTQQAVGNPLSPQELFENIDCCQLVSFKSPEFLNKNRHAIAASIAKIESREVKSRVHTAPLVEPPREGDAA